MLLEIIKNANFFNYSKKNCDFSINWIPPKLIRVNDDSYFEVKYLKNSLQVLLLLSMISLFLSPSNNFFLYVRRCNNMQ